MIYRNVLLTFLRRLPYFKHNQIKILPLACSIFR